MNKILTTSIVTLLAACLLIAGCSGGSSAATPTTQQAPKVGQLAPDFTLKTIDGKSVSLKSYRGQTVVINFWATYCGPCVDELPEFQEAFTERTGQGLVMLFINAGEETTKASDFIKGNGYTFAVLLDSDTKVSMMYGVQYLPTTLLIDTNGVVEKIKIGGFATKNDIDFFLPQKPAS